MITPIETVYRCRIDYARIGEDAIGQDDAEKRAFQMARNEPKVDIESFDGCPACHPYIQLESFDLVPLRRLAEKIERYIKRRTIFELIE
ncbi:hypothetical protein [Vreelandella venusta]|uniref:hypothetical protein n=1 Tax=Vreelandella venusta TaxID=44935 RepID=UPI00116D7360|nr:hypothetical protein [Halomonas venusta]GEK52400.1 hypothetical protein HVE01_31210 [Halomonas venusta]